MAWILQNYLKIYCSRCIDTGFQGEVRNVVNGGFSVEPSHPNCDQMNACF